MRCPFGCREAHRKEESTRRSVEHNRSEAGKKKKSALNNRRRSGGKPSGPVKTSTDKESDPQVRTNALNGAIVEHVQVVVSLIEGRCVSLKEVLAMLERKMRQHSLGKRRKIEYMMRQLNENPP